ncbi:hypothetical protein [Methanococcoides alaskense]|uniref:RNA polymerase-binding transcription factor DksA n=1 Tax=Methanococcoides alaskense TaxID=325778 RepID=A0AA90U1E2_9EURY|nr:hypothetical protein [Methanococcoides alaskense]MDA0524217.1 hypothetical protein [Methanococcoides alaskense]MDR6223660.1 RNA polymerase-binding transcription factor DksA [Methanococcoides alaskense]
MKDCQLKGLILKSILTGNNTSRAIFESIPYENYQSFKVELVNLRKRGYIIKKGQKQPFHYQLTSPKGIEHAKNPNINKEKFDALVMSQANPIAVEMVDVILNNKELFNQAVDNKIRSKGLFEGGIAVVQEAHSKPSNFVSSNDKNYEGQDSSEEVKKLRKLLGEKDKRISDLEIELMDIQKPVVTMQLKQESASEGNQSKRKSQQLLKSENNHKKLAESRYKLCKRFYDSKVYLTGDFFRKYQNMLPILLSGKTLFNRGSVEILSHAEFKREQERKHAKAPLKDKDILRYHFKITKLGKNSITVESDKMLKPKVMIF